MPLACLGLTKTDFILRAVKIELVAAFHGQKVHSIFRQKMQSKMQAYFVKIPIGY